MWHHSTILLKYRKKSFVNTFVAVRESPFFPMSLYLILERGRAPRWGLSGGSFKLSVRLDLLVHVRRSLVLTRDTLCRSHRSFLPVEHTSPISISPPTTPEQLLCLSLPRSRDSAKPPLFSVGPVPMRPASRPPPLSFFLTAAPSVRPRVCSSLCLSLVLLGTLAHKSKGFISPGRSRQAGARDS